MISRDKILSAAARVYAEAGFRGSTTRRIADAAGMNEVTIFRLFGSKAALLSEAVRHSAPAGIAHQLPAEPRNPERELTAWASVQLDFLRIHGSMIRKSLAEVEELPGMGTQACEGCMRGRIDLRRYARKLCERWGTTRSVDLDAAVAMLIGAIMSDAIARDVMPAGFPEPAERAAAAYVRVFLRAIGKPAAAAPRPRKARARRTTTKS
jgi:AcrR family transcriptional regulator